MIHNHLDHSPDLRYTVAKEYTGAPRPRYVARFCGEYIGNSSVAGEAWELAQEHYDNHKIDKCWFL